MMAGKHTIQVSVLADTKKFSSAMKGLSDATGLTKLGGLAKKAGIAVAAVGSVAAVGIGMAVGKASELEQSVGAVDSVFKENAGQIHAWAKSAAGDLGLTQNEYNELATIMGTQLKNGGTALDEMGGKTNELMGLGADLAAMFGGSTSDAVGALSSALKGERDPIEKYGVSLKQATIDAKAAEMGFTKVGGSLSDEANQAATLALIMEQTADAHGTFAKESDTLAGKQQRLQATLGNLATRIGTIFLPLVSQLAGFIGDKVMPAIENWAGVLERNLGPALATAGEWIQNVLLPGLQTLGDWLMANVVPALQAMGSYITGTLVPALLAFGQWLIDAQGWLLPLVAAIAGMAIAWAAWTAAVNIWSAITKVATAVQAALNAVLKANPIGIVITLIAGLVAALIYLYNNNETVRAAIDKAWSMIRGAIDAVAGWITGTAVPGIVRAWESLTTGVSSMWSKVSGFFSNFRSGVSDLAGKVGDAVGRVVSAVGDMASNIGTKIGDAVKWFLDLPKRLADAVRGIPSQMKGVGRNIIQGLIDGVMNMASNLVGKVRGVIDDAIGGAKRLLGIASPSRVFRVIGEQTGDGLRIGLERAQRSIRDAAGDLAATVVTAGTPAELALPTGSLGAGRYGQPIQIIIQALVPTPETGRLVADALRPYLARGGSL